MGFSSVNHPFMEHGNSHIKDVDRHHREHDREHGAGGDGEERRNGHRLIDGFRVGSNMHHNIPIYMQICRQSGGCCMTIEFLGHL